MNRYQNLGRNRRYPDAPSEEELLQILPSDLDKKDGHGGMWDEVSINEPPEGFMKFYNPYTIYSLFIYFVFTKGMVAGIGIIYLMQVSFCRKTLDVDARQCQIMSVIASIPWSLRGVIAVWLCNWKSAVSPSENMSRYYKTSEALYIILACLLCISCLLLLALGTYSSPGAGILLGGTNFGICVLDVIMNGVYSRLVHKGQSVREQERGYGRTDKAPDHASTLIFLSATSYQIGAILAAAIVGPVVELMNPRLIFFVAAALVSTNFVPVFFDFIGEIDVSMVPEKDGPLRHKYTKFRNVSIVTAVLAALNSWLSISLQESHNLAVYSAISMVILIVYNYYELRDTGAEGDTRAVDAQKLLVSPASSDFSWFYSIGVSIILLQTSLSANVFTAEAYFLTERDGCSKKMPRFSYIDFNTVGAIISAVSGWIGIQIFRRGFTGSSLRYMFVSTAWLQVSVRTIRALLPLGLFGSSEALNWPYFIVVYCIIAPAATYMYNMPSLMLIPHLIQSEHSTIGFAAVVSLQSYARVAAIQYGLLAIEFSDLQKQGPCDFCNLWLVQIGSQVLLPLLCLPLLYYYIPKSKL